ncbi:MAG TPA: 5-formyltetrahydrofolate cyclo-ligase [Candidatus Sulfotelmatobacter sp.]|jgi:5-formyltetrahydrofolate cyclo-ligase|nr:5-formyltetrahydrofolate cyclo-ligase [Candidatus Sulfotelmatobacter sp.]
MNLHSKSDLRLKVREALGKISLAVRMVESIDLCARLEPQLRSAHRILFYSPLEDELDVWPLLEKLLKTPTVCALPAFDVATQAYSARRVKNLETDIFSGKFGISEPVEGCEEILLNEFDLVLVPGMAFDLSGNRLGRGRGFYDRILAQASGIKCGVSHDFQLVEQLPTEVHDVRVDFIFTPNRCVKRRK